MNQVKIDAIIDSFGKRKIRHYQEQINEVIWSRGAQRKCQRCKPFIIIYPQNIQRITIIVMVLNYRSGPKISFIIEKTWKKTKQYVDLVSTGKVKGTLSVYEIRISLGKWWVYFSLECFYGISTIVGYLITNRLYSCILDTWLVNTFCW